MSVQQSFYALEADVRTLFEPPGPLAFLAVEPLDPSPTGSPLFEIWPTFLAYLLPPGAAREEVAWRPLSGGRGRVVVQHSPVLELYVASGNVTLEPSRIYLGAAQVTPCRREAMAYFRRLQRQIVKWPRCLPSGQPVGPAAEAAVRAGVIRLVDGRQEQTM